jgi:hypothetical protein
LNGITTATGLAGLTCYAAIFATVVGDGAGAGGSGNGLGTCA